MWEGGKCSEFAQPLSISERQFWQRNYFFHPQVYCLPFHRNYVRQEVMCLKPLNLKMKRKKKKKKTESSPSKQTNSGGACSLERSTDYQCKLFWDPGEPQPWPCWHRSAGSGTTHLREFPDQRQVWPLLLFVLRLPQRDPHAPWGPLSESREVTRLAGQFIYTLSYQASTLFFLVFATVVKYLKVIIPLFLLFFHNSTNIY